jgi:hypothetical protein
VIGETKSLVFGKLLENLKKILYNIYRKLRKELLKMPR